MELEFSRGRLSQVVESLASSLELVTKSLKLQRIGINNSKRKLVISTNWLNVMNFHKGTEVTETVIGNLEGLEIRPAKPGDDIKMVYERSYRHREKETLMDIRSQSKIEPAFGHAERVHITLQKDLITIKPVFAPEHRSIDGNLCVKLGRDDKGLYSGILKALKYIKDNTYKEITIESDKDFSESQEGILMRLQLRRMGYHVELTSTGMTAYFHKHDKGTQNKLYPFIPGLTKKGVSFNASSPYGFFSACTGGVDVFQMESEGMKLFSMLDWRNPEKRDFKTNNGKRVHYDKTEHCAITAAVNARCLKTLYNEDIYQFDSRIVKSNHHNLLQISLQCDDFSLLKNEEDRERAIMSLDSTRDMFIPALWMIDNMNVPMVLMENVKTFSKSVEHDLFLYGLTNMGYQVHSMILKPKDVGGYTKRERCYVFATKLEVDFSMSTENRGHTTINIWNDIIAPNFDELRDITHTKTLQKALTSGRLRVIKHGDQFGPTITKSQSRQVKDSVYVESNGRYYMPSNDILKKMMSIPASFNTDFLSSEMTTEIIGQSCDLKVHRALGVSIKQHIDQYLSKIKNRFKLHSITNNKQLDLFV